MEKFYDKFKSCLSHKQSRFIRTPVQTSLAEKPFRDQSTKSVTTRRAPNKPAPRFNNGIHW